jgi:hypothetical protein
MSSTETTTLFEYDYLNVQLRDASGEFLRTLQTLSNLSAQGEWTSETFDLAELEGQLVRLEFVHTSDTSNPTTFYIDDVSLTVCDAPPPPIPVTPVLLPIHNPNGHSTYTVTWSATPLAESYVLQEDDDPAFSSPTIEYSGLNTECLAGGWPPGRYYYRVKAVNSSSGKDFSSAWSNTEQTSVWQYIAMPGTDDTYVASARPSAWFGDLDQMLVGYDATYCEPPCGVSRALIKGFDLSSIPSTATIHRADFRIDDVLVDYHASTEHTFTVYAITSAWDPATVTWSSRPTYGDAYGSVVIPAGGGTQYVIDIAPLVQGWVDGTIPRYGIMLRGPEDGPDTTLVGFATHEVEYPAPGYPTSLYIGYE